MRGVNKVIIVGTLGRDPEIRYATNGGAIANLSVATSEQWSDRTTGDRQERTEWHRVVIFGKMADIAGQYLKKGAQVYVEGKLQTRKWQDQATQQDKYTTAVVVDMAGTMQMVGSKNSDSDPVPKNIHDMRAERPAVSGGVAHPSVANKPKGSSVNAPSSYIEDFDDIDFPF